MNSKTLGVRGGGGASASASPDYYEDDETTEPNAPQSRETDPLQMSNGGNEFRGSRRKRDAFEDVEDEDEEPGTPPPPVPKKTKARAVVQQPRTSQFKPQRPISRPQQRPLSPESQFIHNDNGLPDDEAPNDEAPDDGLPDVNSLHAKKPTATTVQRQPSQKQTSQRQGQPSQKQTSQKQTSQKQTSQKQTSQRQTQPSQKQTSQKQTSQRQTQPSQKQPPQHQDQALVQRQTVNPPAPHNPSAPQTTFIRASDSRNVDINGRTYIEYTKTEEEAIMELEILDRQHFLSAGFVRDDEAIMRLARKVFPSVPIGTTNAIIKLATKKTRRDLKNWKSVVIRNCASLMKELIATHPDRSVRYMTGFKELQEVIVNTYQVHWLQKIFNMSTPSVDFTKITPLGMRFLKYTTIQCMAHCRLTEILTSSNDADVLQSVKKYTRGHLLDMFDGLHKKKGYGFEDLGDDDFPMRAVPVSAKRSLRRVVDLNDDSDGDVEGLFTDDEAENEAGNDGS